jgi:peptide/nickel transport system substrate-binding protein
VRAVIGTGPFRLTALTPPQGFEAERFDGWWGGKVAAARARYLAVTRGETRTLMADTGEADLVFNLPPTAFQRLSRNPRVALTTAAIPRSYILKLNAGGFFFGDVRARRALSMAIDRAGIAAGLLRTPDAAATQLFPPSLSGWHDPSLPPLAHDPQAARRLLAEVGWQPGADGVLARGGRAFRVTLRTFPDRPEQPVLATAIQAQLKEIGIVAEVAIGNSGDIPLGHRDGTLDLGLAARNFSLVPDPIGTLLQDYGPEGGDWGAMGWSGAGSAELAELIGTLSGTFDPAAAAILRHRAAAILQAELPVVPLAWFVHSVATGCPTSASAPDHARPFPHPGRARGPGHHRGAAGRRDRLPAGAHAARRHRHAHRRRPLRHGPRQRHGRGPRDAGTRPRPPLDGAAARLAVARGAARPGRVPGHGGAGDG